MVVVALIQQRRGTIQQVHLVQVRVVQVLAFLPAFTSNPRDVLDAVDRNDGVGAPFARGELPFEISVVIVQVIMAPAIALGKPDEIATRFHIHRSLRLERTPISFRITHEHFAHAGLRIELDKFQVALQTIATNDAHCRARLAHPVTRALRGRATRRAATTTNANTNGARRNNPLITPLLHRCLFRRCITADVRPHFRLWNAVFTRHGIRILHQCRTRFSQRTHEIHFSHTALVCARNVKCA